MGISLETSEKRKEAVQEKTGISLQSFYNPVVMHPVKYAQEIQEKTGISLPSYYNPAVMNPMKYAQQIQKRQLLWGNKVIYPSIN